MEPDYGKIKLVALPDTLVFPLSENTFNSVKSVSFFIWDQEIMFSFFDDRSKSVNIYNFKSGKLRARYDFNKRKTGVGIGSAYAVAPDSIYVVNPQKLLLMDSTGNIRKEIPFPAEPKFAYAKITTTQPVTERAGHVFLVIGPAVNTSKKKEAERWKTIYDFDLRKGTAKPVYTLPDVYHGNNFGRKFLDHHICMNDLGNIVISFSADTNIYETDINHANIAYRAMSNLQQHPLIPPGEEAIKSDTAKIRFYMTNFAYGAIYYDAVNHRYLRQVKLPLQEKDFSPRDALREQQLLILDKDFRIIGESSFSKDFILKHLLVTPDGSIFARVESRDEYSLKFVRLEYRESVPIQLGQKSN